jgi:hypothetical protein
MESAPRSVWIDPSWLSWKSYNESSEYLQDDADARTYGIHQHAARFSVSGMGPTCGAPVRKFRMSSRNSSSVSLFLVYDTKKGCHRGSSGRSSSSLTFQKLLRSGSSEDRSRPV